MNLFDSEFYLQTVSNLNTLPATDFEDEYEHKVAVPSFSMIPERVISPETQQKLYTSFEFKKFLKEYVEGKFNIKKDNIADEYSEKIYRRMYDKGLARFNNNLFTKVMYHPDVTKTDYEFIRDSRAKFPKHVIYNELACFMIMMMVYYKSPLGKKMKQNMKFGLIVLGSAPLVVLFGTQKLNTTLLNRKIKKMNLHSKYNIKNFS